MRFRSYDLRQNCYKRHLAFQKYIDITYENENKSIEVRDDDSGP